MFLLFIKAFIFGIAVAAPIGPMGVLCMRRTLVQGWKSGVATALGIAVCDALYAAIAALGLTKISEFILANKVGFNLVAGMFIGCYGIKIFLSKNEPKIANKEISYVSLPYAFGSSLMMTLTNPLTILFFVTVFATLTPQSGFDNLSSAITIGSVFSGSLSWYIGIIASVSFFRDVISDKKRMLIEKITGIFLIIFGILEICQIF